MIFSFHTVSELFLCHLFILPILLSVDLILLHHFLFKIIVYYLVVISFILSLLYTLKTCRCYFIFGRNSSIIKVTG
jgi:hypothetical protein